MPMPRDDGAIGLKSKSYDVFRSGFGTVQSIPVSELPPLPESAPGAYSRNIHMPNNSMQLFSPECFSPETSSGVATINDMSYCTEVFKTNQRGNGGSDKPVLFREAVEKEKARLSNTCCNAAGSAYSHNKRVDISEYSSSEDTLREPREERKNNLSGTGAEHGLLRAGSLARLLLDGKYKESPEKFLEVERTVDATIEHVSFNDLSQSASPVQLRAHIGEVSEEETPDDLSSHPRKQKELPIHSYEEDLALHGFYPGNTQPWLLPETLTVDNSILDGGYQIKQEPDPSTNSSQELSKNIKASPSAKANSFYPSNTKSSLLLKTKQMKQERQDSASTRVMDTSLPQTTLSNNMSNSLTNPQIKQQHNSSKSNSLQDLSSYMESQKFVKESTTPNSSTNPNVAFKQFYIDRYNQIKDQIKKANLNKDKDERELMASNSTKNNSLTSINSCVGRKKFNMYIFLPPKYFLSNGVNRMDVALRSSYKSKT
ncbi:hypothetical protein SNE40_004823 [Patella caerulea]|uniref:Uncharacterized protein n=1 Tax=Patella caerulea TaxID=87958 RepID=A0AAN8PYL0_PATCE